MSMTEVEVTIPYVIGGTVIEDTPEDFGGNYTDEFSAVHDGWGCTRRLGHVGDHMAGVGDPHVVLLAWLVKP